jgi:hypothetical protein
MKRRLRETSLIVKPSLCSHCRCNYSRPTCMAIWTERRRWQANVCYRSAAESYVLAAARQRSGTQLRG